MRKEIIAPERSTVLRKNNSELLKIYIDQDHLQNVFLIKGSRFKTENISLLDFIISPYEHYMIINDWKNPLKIKYNQDISHHEVVYNPYKFEHSEKTALKAEFFTERYNIPEDYIDTLPKWYSFKFTYSHYNLIFVKPQMGLSIQTHKFRNEEWEIIKGNPILIIDSKVYYNVQEGIQYKNPINSYHSIINPSSNPENFVLFKETWNGKFDEKDIKRVFNPNQYFD